MRGLIQSLAIGAALVLGAAASPASVITLSTALSGASEAPPTGSPGTGFATIELDDVANTLHLNVAFSGLGGTTTAAHIHCCVVPPANGGVATPVPTFPGFPLGVTDGIYDIVLDLSSAASFNPAFVVSSGGTTASAAAALTAGLLAGQAYLNIHTSLFGGGEIRGFFNVVSVPATLTLVLCGIALAWFRRGGRAAAR